MHKTNLNAKAIDTLNALTPNRVYGVSWNYDGEITSLTTIASAPTAKAVEVFTSEYDQEQINSLVDVCLANVQEGRMVVLFDVMSLPGTPVNIIGTASNAFAYTRKPLFVAQTIEEAISWVFDASNGKLSKTYSHIALRYKSRQRKWQVCAGALFTNTAQITKEFCNENPQLRVYNPETKAHYWFDHATYVSDDRD